MYTLINKKQFSFNQRPLFNMGRDNSPLVILIVLLCGLFQLSLGCRMCRDQRWLCANQEDWRSCEHVCLYVIHGQEDHICQHLCRFQEVSNANASTGPADTSSCLDQRWLCQNRDYLRDCERVCMHDLDGLDRTWQRLCRMVDGNNYGTNVTTNTGNLKVRAQETTSGY